MVFDEADKDITGCIDSRGSDFFNFLRESSESASAEMEFGKSQCFNRRCTKSAAAKPARRNQTAEQIPASMPCAKAKPQPADL